MVSIPKSTALSKICVLVALIAVALYALGAVYSQWIKKKFTIPAYPPLSPVPLKVDATLGLVERCSHITAMGVVIRDKCGRDGARQWQKTSSGLGAAGALLALIGLVLVILNVTVQKVAGRRGLKLAIAGCSFGAAGFLAAAMIIYDVERRDLQVNRSLPFRITFGIGWSYIVSACSAGFHGILMLLALIDSCSSTETTNEPSNADKYAVPGQNDNSGKYDANAGMQWSKQEPSVRYTTGPIAPY